MSPALFGVWCRVYGGRTGTRVAWLKDGGVRYETEDAEAAAKRASHLNATMNGPNATAHFEYKPMRIPS